MLISNSKASNSERIFRFLRPNDIHTIEFNTEMYITPKQDKNASLDDILVPRDGTSKSKIKLIFTVSEIEGLFKTEVSSA